jgi:quinol monooxygenase YgiN
MSEILGIARFTFHEGKVEEYKRLTERAKDIVEAKDTGTLDYKVYFNADQSEAVVIERYRDSQALIEHSEHLADLTPAILATADVEGEVLGEASLELKRRLAESPVQLFTPYQL